MTGPRAVHLLTAVATLLVAGTLAAPAPAPAASAPPAVDGGRGSGDVLFPHVGNRGYDVRHYGIRVAWTPAPDLAESTIVATTRIRARTTGRALRSFSLDLEGLDVDSVRVDGRAAAFVRRDDDAAVRHKLVVTPRRPVRGTFRTVVRYSGVPTSHTDADGSSEGWNATDDGATFLGQPVGSMTLFPNNNTPKDKATYRIRVDVPSRLTAVSNGELASHARRPGGWRRWVWRQREPMASELAIVSIGRYRTYRSTIALGGGRRVREWSFVDADVQGAALRRTLAARARMGRVLRFLQRRLGPYPGRSVGFVVDRVPDGINYALETQDRPFFPGSMDLGTMVHELTHQWYGDSVSPRVWNDIWINEGMATWMPTYRDEVRGGPSTAETWFEAWRRRPADDPFWRIPPARMTDSADLFGGQTYSRGAQMYEALRLTVGDRDFFRFVAGWQARHRGGSAGIRQFTGLAERISGRDLTTFFRDWLLDADRPRWPGR